MKGPQQISRIVQYKESQNDMSHSLWKRVLDNCQGYGDLETPSWTDKRMSWEQFRKEDCLARLGRIRNRQKDVRKSYRGPYIGLYGIS